VFKGTAGIVNTIMKTPMKFQYSSVIANCCGSISYLFFRCTKSFMNPTRRSRTEILWARGALPHVSPYTTQYLCIQISKINGPLSQNFSSNHRINTSTPAFWSRIKLTKNIIRLCLHRPQSEKTLF
jgi:hypothetical protein